MADNEYRPVPQSFELDKLQDELRRIADITPKAVRPANTYRTEEIAEALGYGKEKARKQIREWVRMGVCKTTTAPYENLWGVVQNVKMVTFIAGKDRSEQLSLM